PRLLEPFAWFDVVGAAAVDPEQEARLVGLDKAVSSGRYLQAGDQFTVTQVNDNTGKYQRESIPVLASTKVFTDSRFSLGAQRLPTAAAAAVPGTASDALVPVLRAADGTALGQVAQQSDVDVPLSRVQNMVSFNDLFQPAL